MNKIEKKGAREDLREEQRQRHVEFIAITEWEAMIESEFKPLSSEGVTCFNCGYLLHGEWCHRCQDIGVKIKSKV